MDNELEIGDFSIDPNEKPAKEVPPPFLPLPKLISRFKYLSDCERAWRGQKKIWRNFYDGIQLTSDELSELDSRAQPSVTINKIAPRIDVVVGMNTSNRFGTKAYPRNLSDEDISTADAVTQGLRFIEDTNNQRFLESEVFEDGCISGRGWFEVTTNFDENFDLDVIVKARHSDDIFIDPASRDYNLKDCKDLVDSCFVNEEDLIALFPEFEREIKFALSPEFSSERHRVVVGDQYQAKQDDLRNLFIDVKNKRVRVSKYWFKTREMRKFVISPMGIDRLSRTVTDKDIKKIRSEIKKLTKEEPTIIEKQTDVVRVQTFISTAILELKEPEFLGSRFPYVPFLVKREGLSGMPYGLVKPMMDPQREINKRRSKALHAMNTERTVYEEGAVDSEDTLKRELARPDGIIKKNRGFEIDFQSNREITQSQLQFYEASNAELDAVTGITPDLLGMQTNARNATALMQRTRQSLSVLNRVFENWKRTRISLEELKLLFMQEFWSNEKVIRVTDDQNIVRIVPLNKSIRGPGGQELKIHDIRAGKYDIVIDEADESINRMQEMFSELTKLAQTGQVPPELVFEFAPVPKALRDRLLGKLQESQMQQQQMMAQQAQLAAAQGETGQSEQPQAAPGQ